MEKQSESEEEKKEVVLQTDPGWSDYVMSYFTPDELVGDGRDAKPKVAGLRRVTELLIGKVVNSEVTNIFHVPDETPNGKTFAVYRIVISPHRQKSSNPTVELKGAGKRCSESTLEQPQLVYSEAADCSSYNTDSPFEVFGAAMAATRAEARALRKALKLHRVAAEECSDKASKREEPRNRRHDSSDEHRLINSDQERFIVSQCLKLDVDVDRFINSGEKNYPTIRSVPYDIAKKMTQRINEYKNGTTEIPEGIKKGEE